jgi:hypothetical protein
MNARTVTVAAIVVSLVSPSVANAQEPETSPQQTLAEPQAQESEQGEPATAAQPDQTGEVQRATAAGQPETISPAPPEPPSGPVSLSPSAPETVFVPSPQPVDLEASSAVEMSSNRPMMTMRGPIAGWYLMIAAMPYLAITSEAASRNELSAGGSAGTLAGGAYLFRILEVGLEIGLGEPYKDLAEFEESTTGGVQESRIDVYYFSAFLGVSTPPILFTQSHHWGFDPGVNVGYTLAFGEYRHIEDCVDCSEEDLSIDGGLFIEPHLDFFYANPRGEGRGILKAGIGLAYREYFLGDLQRAAIIRLFIGVI